MTTIAIPHKKTSRLNLLTWAGSFLFHGTLIISALTFLTHIPPKPAAKVLKWKVSLVQPRVPSPDPAERVQTVKPPSPTHRTTVSRPLQHRQVVERRPIQREQSSIHQTAASLQQKRLPIKTKSIAQKIPMQATASPQASPTQVAQTTTRISTTQSRLLQTVRTVQNEAANSPIKTVQVGPQTVSTKTSRQISENAVTKTISTVQTRNGQRRQQLSSLAFSTASASTPMRNSHEEFTQPVLRSSTAPTVNRAQTKHVQQLVTRSTTGHHRVASGRKQAKTTMKQPVLYAGAPDQQSIQKLLHRSKPSTISREATNSRQKKSSDKRLTSNQLSPEALEFLKLLREKIEKYRQYPRVAKRLGYQGTTTVSFSLSHTGDLTLLKVADPSGHSMLDEAALTAVQHITPLKPPTTIGNTVIEIPVAFELTR